MPLREHLKADLTKAMKAREGRTVITLRSALAAIDNAEAVELNASAAPVVGKANDVPRRVLTEEQIRNILQAEADEYRFAAAEYQRLGKLAEAVELRMALEVISYYLGAEHC